MSMSLSLFVALHSMAPLATPSLPGDTLHGGQVLQQEQPQRLAQNAGAVLHDGLVLGVSANAFYGQVQVQAVVQGGKLASVKVVKFPNDRNTSRYINNQAIPVLRQEAIQAQGGHIDTVSGATLTSDAFATSLADALGQAAGSVAPASSNGA